MRTEILIWSLFILCLVVHSACESTSNPKTGGYTPLKKQHGHLKLKDVYDMMNKSSRKDHQIMHEVQHLRISEKAKPSYGGASDLRHTHPGKGAASPLLAKPPQFFLFAVLRHVAVGSIIFALY
ncbi:hypothetical protein D8674_040288 [Pyrus ussuriensis x Pyrus communis]|uniref:Uncharacterized protein n=1 Tax=Pyrus ussuriensis x Pyrus communis TaxID=2448454 RepID=A0A5N5FTL4_9ROSA|nr:hypothetical protein D8674_040288 [Pyrus ussuriensis x Pyrus communis]